ncbi:hypothetical protein [Roseobacter sp.]|uniref:hypothetical protein n=1 Tax=Roseobacter sp. TaxID=1907202 RepID=UPI0038598A84
MNVKFMMLGKDSDTITNDQLRVSTALVLSASTTGANISKLVEQLSICSKDALPLARTFYESSLQACFVLADGDESAQRAEYYSVYRAFASQTEHFELGRAVGLIQSSTRLDRNNPTVKRAIEIFAPKKGKRARPCFDASRDEMIRRIKDVSPHAAIGFQGVEGMNFDFASEISHGSYHAHNLLSGHLEPSISASNEILQEVAFRATVTVALCSDAIARTMLSVSKELDEAKYVIEACNLFFADEVPEMAQDLQKLNI